MKLHFILALLAVQSSLHADWVIIQKTSTDGHEKKMTIKVKDNRIRNDIGDSITVIINGSDGVAELYSHSKKTVMRIDPAALQGVTALASKFLNKGDGPAAKPMATGEKVKVGDWDTEVYTWQGKLGSGKFYIAKDFPKFADINAAMDKVNKAMTNPMAGLMPGSSDFPGMIVKSETTMLGKTTSGELVSATEQPVDDADFKAPEGYKEMKIPTLPTGLFQPKQSKQ